MWRAPVTGHEGVALPPVTQPRSSQEAQEQQRGGPSLLVLSKDPYVSGDADFHFVGGVSWGCAAMGPRPPASAARGV